MASLDDVARRQAAVDDADRQWLHELVSDWQLLADLSFADLVLWLPDREHRGFWAAAQMRPTTGPTALVDDVVGTFLPRGANPPLDDAFDSGRIRREGDPEWYADMPVRIEAIPVRRAERVVGVIARTTNLISVRTPSRLELTYLQTATDLARMISEGRFPEPGERVALDTSPRVGDGSIRLDAAGTVGYASPNAQSAYRRLGMTGDLAGVNLGQLTAGLVPAPLTPIDESLATQLSGRSAAEVEVENDLATLIVRTIPLRPGGVQIGALVLLRDITDLRRRERELLTKEATIREIHHRVKNNLQSVAALLRLQARRLPTADARAALEEAVRRVGSIAVVHETLSQSFDERVDFDQVADRVLATVGEVSAAESARPPVRHGSFGVVAAGIAAPLAMALTEMLQNAVQHGSCGEAAIDVRVTRRNGRLRVVVDDAGPGLPTGFDIEKDGGLGLQIVRTLTESELGGRFRLRNRPGGGASAVLDVPLDEPARDRDTAGGTGS